MNKARLVMYDVRGIQNYIYRTNKVKEIIGASNIVEKLIQKGLSVAIKNEPNDDQFIYEWNNEEKIIEKVSFLHDPNIQMEVLFIGGGNGYVLFRDEEVMHRINRRMSKFIMDETYSLRLAIASIETDLSDYLSDYKSIQEKMALVKAKMTDAQPMCGCPIVETDDMTGYPVIKKDNKDKITTESDKKTNNVDKIDNPEKIFDNMVTDKGSNSVLAIVHIDGNNLGGRIKEIIESKRNIKYEESVLCERELSNNIRHKFLNVYKKTENKISEWVMSDKCSFKNKKYADDNYKKYIRKIIVAGDDITFVCNGKIALSVVEYFLKNISKEVMYGDNTDLDDIKKYGFSACAGIAYINSHFPFSEGYKMAEECCESAKKRAKLNENVINTEDGYKIIGNYIDFHICKHIEIVDLEGQRESEKNPDGTYLYRRPYYVPYEKDIDKFTELNDKNKDYCIFKFIECLNYFSNEEKIPRSFSKQLRNVYTKGRNAVDEYLSFLGSREKDLKNVFEEESYRSDNVASWYDALELMDLYTDIQED